MINAASELMRERDTLDISFLEIGAKADLPAGLIGYHFGSKEGLLYAILEADVRQALDQLDALTKSNMTPTDKMRLHLAGIVKTYYKVPYFNRLLQAMTRDASLERVRMISERMIRPMTEAQSRIIDEGVACGEFRPVDKVLFYFATVGAADGLHSSRFILNSVFGIEEVDQALNRRNVEQIVDIFMRALLL